MLMYKVQQKPGVEWWLDGWMEKEEDSVEGRSRGWVGS